MGSSKLLTGLIWSLIFLAPYFASADRTVSVIPNQGGLEVANPSSVSQTITLTCKNGAGTQFFSHNPPAIGPGQTYVAPFRGCSEKENQRYGLPSDGNKPHIYACAKNMGSYNVKYSEAASMCGSGYHLCNVQDSVDRTKLAEFSGLTPHYWLQSTVSGSASPFYSWDGTSWNSYDGSGVVPVTGYSSSSLCGQDNTTGNDVPQCEQENPTNSQDGALCCVDPGTPVFADPGAQGGFCSITVNGNSGHLVTPSFKGGTPF